MEIKNFREFFKSKTILSYVLTFGVEFVIMLITIVLFKFVAVKFLDTGFAEFSINKRLVGFLMPLMMLGLGVSLPKFLPLENEKKQLEIHYSALIIVSSLFLFSLIIFLFNSAYLSHLAFGDFNHEKMFAASLLYVYSLMLHACIYNYFRGKFDFVISSLLQLVNLGVLPFIFFFLVNDVYHLFLILSIGTIGLLLLINSIYIPLIKLKSFDCFQNIKLLVKYGIRRAPGDVILGLFLFIPTYLASNYFSLTIAGNVAFCLSLFNIVIAIMSPINIILLPKASKIVFEKDFSLLRIISSKLLIVSIGVGIISLAVVYIFGENILIMFNVKDYLEVAGYLNIIFFGVIGFSLFSVIRSIIDAYYEKARVASIIIISFLFFIFCILIIKYFDLFSIKNILIAFTFSINFLGLLTYFILTRINKRIQQ